MHPPDEAFSEREEELLDLATLRAAMAADDGTRYMHAQVCEELGS
ncbi:hypothetical protein QP500_06465 [Pauljensenia sp. UMB0018B]|nr:hypothetical protein [Schaalia odontolytica]MDK7340102.1 hypothetical protein [Pauljensenia sp. UMB0018B]